MAQKPFFHHKVLWMIGVFGFILLAGGIFLIITPPTASTQSDDVINNTTVHFSHRVHVQEVGVNCEFCHSSARRAPQAGLPALETCLVCHNYFTPEETESQENLASLFDAIENNQQPVWPDVYKQPDFVYFSHRPHINAEVSCQTCHGDVQNMDLVVQQIDMNMGFCLDCHWKQAEIQPLEADIPRLIECTTCHK